MVTILRYMREFSQMILSAFRKRNQRALRKLNDEVLSAAATELSKPLFDLAVLSYALSKIVSKPRFLEREYEGRLRAIEGALADLVYISNDEDERISKSIQSAEKSITSLEKEDPRFIINMMTKAKLKMAATLYAQGMSLGVACEFSGQEKQEVLDYAGATMMFDRVKDEKDIKERMKLARKLIEE